MSLHPTWSGAPPRTWLNTARKASPRGGAPTQGCLARLAGLA